MFPRFHTPRLSLTPLQASDHLFIKELVNSKGWLDFIGDRQVHTEADAMAYVQKIINNPGVVYWVVRKNTGNIPIGVVTRIQRDYLDYHDLGFAFLPAFNGKGYAQEASKPVLHYMASDPSNQEVLATTVPENIRSIQLLEKLGLKLIREIEVEKEKLLLYGITADEVLLSHLTHLFFGVFCNRDVAPKLELLHEICLSQAQIIHRTPEKETVYDLETFITPRQKILTDGSLIQFEEKEIKAETKIIHNIAQRYSRYEKSGIRDGQDFRQTGHKFLQFVRSAGQWKISSVLWEDDAL